MAIDSNDSNVEVIKGIKLYSGITTMKVLAVNPTMEKLHSMDIKVKQEPVYFTEINGTEYFKVVFWMTNSEVIGNVTTRAEFLLSDKPQTSTAGDKTQWINSVSPIQDTWSAEAPTYEWWKKEGERKAYVGEVKLIKFIQAWANVAGGGQVMLDTINQIVKGDVTEIQQLVTALQNNQVRVLLGVKDSKYQQVYMNYFGRVKPQRDDFFIKPLNDEYTKFKADYNETLDYSEFIPRIEPTAIVPDTPAEDSDWV